MRIFTASSCDDTISDVLCCRYYDDRSLYFEEISGDERGATNRLLPRHTYILSTADLVASTHTAAANTGSDRSGVQHIANIKEHDRARYVHPCLPSRRKIAIRTMP